MMRAIGISVLGLVYFTTGSAQTAEKLFSCPHSVKEEVLFTSADVPDTLHIDIIGDDCATADISMMVVTTDGEVALAVRSPLKYDVERTYTGSDHHGVGNGDVYSERHVTLVLGTLVNEGPIMGESLQSDAVMREKHFFSNVNWEAVERAREGEIPVLQHHIGLIQTKVYAWLDGRAVHLFDFGT